MGALEITLLHHNNFNLINKNICFYRSQSRFQTVWTKRHSKFWKVIFEKEEEEMTIYFTERQICGL